MENIIAINKNVYTIPYCVLVNPGKYRVSYAYKDNTGNIINSSKGFSTQNLAQNWVNQHKHLIRNYL